MARLDEQTRSARRSKRRAPRAGGIAAAPGGKRDGTVQPTAATTTSRPCAGRHPGALLGLPSGARERLGSDADDCWPSCG